MNPAASRTRKSGDCNTMKSTIVRFGMASALLAIVLVVSYWKFLKPPEDPLCRGVRLSEWLQTPNLDLNSSPIQKDDLRSIAPKAVPFLAYYLQCNRPQTRKGIVAWMPPWLQAKLPPSLVGSKDVEPVKSQTRCLFALDALFWLGPDAKSALPTLLMLLNAPDNELNCGLNYESARAIHGLGPASWPAVLKVLHSGSMEARRAVIFYLPTRFAGSPPPAATEADKKSTVNLLLEACLDPNAVIQVEGLHALAQCWRSPQGSLPLLDPAVPVIIRCMEKGKENVPEVAAHTLTLFPQHARTIIPALKKLEGSSNPAYRLAAIRALKSIEQQKPTGE